jgi:hypothetical protein
MLAFNSKTTRRALPIRFDRELSINGEKEGFGLGNHDFP